MRELGNVQAVKQSPKCWELFQIQLKLNSDTQSVGWGAGVK